MHSWQDSNAAFCQISMNTSYCCCCHLILLEAGRILLCVLYVLQIYPSEYGLEKMKEENISGPSELQESPQLEDNDGDDDGIMAHVLSYK